MKIYVLTVIDENQEEFATVTTDLYANPEDALEAYSKAFDEAQEKEKDYDKPYRHREIATDTPYRYYKISNERIPYDSITIELEAKELN